MQFWGWNTSKKLNVTAYTTVYNNLKEKVKIFLYLKGFFKGFMLDLRLSLKNLNF